MKKWHKNFCRALLYGMLPLVLAAVVIPNFQKAGWTTGGVPFIFEFQVTDAETGDPIRGAGVVVSNPRVFDPGWPAKGNSTGDHSATTDAAGQCWVNSHFPGRGRGNKGWMTIDGKIVFVRATGYDDWERPCESILGKSLEITTGPSVPVKHTLNIPLRKKTAADSEKFSP